MHKVILSKLPTSLLTLIDNWQSISFISCSLLDDSVFGYAGFFLNFVEQNSHEITFREEHMRRSRVIGAL